MQPVIYRVIHLRESGPSTTPTGSYWYVDCGDCGEQGEERRRIFVGYRTGNDAVNSSDDILIVPAEQQSHSCVLQTCL